MQVKFKQWQCVAEFARYNTSKRTAIRLLDENDRSLIAVATVNIDAAKFPANFTLIKNWSENEGMVDALVAAGVIKKPCGSYPTGFVSADLAEFTAAALEAIKKTESR